MSATSSSQTAMQAAIQRASSNPKPSAASATPVASSATAASVGKSTSAAQSLVKYRGMSGAALRAAAIAARQKAGGDTQPEISSSSPTRTRKSQKS